MKEWEENVLVLPCQISQPPHCLSCWSHSMSWLCLHWWPQFRVSKSQFSKHKNPMPIMNLTDSSQKKNHKWPINKWRNCSASLAIKKCKSK
jgi:hypothetical protein